MRPFKTISFNLTALYHGEFVKINLLIGEYANTLKMKIIAFSSEYLSQNTYQKRAHVARKIMKLANSLGFKHRICLKNRCKQPDGKNMPEKPLKAKIEGKTLVIAAATENQPEKARPKTQKT